MESIKSEDVILPQESSFKHLDIVKKNILEAFNKIPKDSVIVYDIDDTLYDVENDKVIQPIVDTYKEALLKGFPIAIITARVGTDENIHYTQLQLTRLGIKDYFTMYFRPEGKTDLYLFKMKARQNLHDRGYKVGISIGDKPWDVGMYGGLSFIV
jgi:hypothetical protein